MDRLQLRLRISFIRLGAAKVLRPLLSNAPVRSFAMEFHYLVFGNLEIAPLAREVRPGCVTGNRLRILHPHSKREAAS